MFEDQTRNFWKAKGRSLSENPARDQSRTFRNADANASQNLSQEQPPAGSFQSQPRRAPLRQGALETPRLKAEAKQQFKLKKPLRRTVYRAIRMDEEVAAIIAEQARQERTNDIHIIQRAVDRYALWHLWEEKMGFISIPTSMEHRLVNALTEGQARELGKHLAETFAKDFVNLVFKTPSLANVLLAFRYLAHPYANFFTLQEHNPEDHTLMFVHGRGVKVSILWEEIISFALRNIAGVEVQVEHSDNQITVHYNLKDPS